LDFNKKSGKIALSKKSDDSKVLRSQDKLVRESNRQEEMLARVDEDGVLFKSPLDGSFHRFTPERSIEIQSSIGADIIFAFDECPPSDLGKDYQIEAMERTHRWAKRSLSKHKSLESVKRKRGESVQALFGIVQGGNYVDLRKRSAEFISQLDFDGFGIGGTFNKKDIGKVVACVNKILPEDKPRHLLGIGEPDDLKEAIRNGCDLFDCVAPTRMGRNGALYTKNGRINILNSQFKSDFNPIEKGCLCYTCLHYNRSYISHLFRAKEMLAATLASIHNLYFIANLVQMERIKILEGKNS
jgi:queuine tRNA-ribosyltransferase